jgi:RNA polymerase sigma factor (TIGR02999 family)
MSDQDLRLEFDELFSLVYEELLRIASAVRRNESHSTLGATALVHETWLRLKDSPQFASTSPMHFKRIAARVIRQVLIEAARERNALKRGGQNALRVTLDDSIEAFEENTLELLEIDQALHQLTEADPRQAQVAELKIFSELTNLEIADEMGMSLSAVERSWRAAKAWLKTRFSGVH